MQHILSEFFTNAQIRLRYGIKCQSLNMMDATAKCPLDKSELVLWKTLEFLKFLLVFISWKIRFDSGCFNILREKFFMNGERVFTTFKKLCFINKLRIIFYPLLLVKDMPIAWIKSLYNARILLNGKWDSYMGFSPSNAINSLFYRTQWVNINRYGRNGVSPVIGLGDYSLARWFHLSLPASYIYANAGAVVTLLGASVWVFSHLIWIETVEWWWVVLLTSILFLSTTSYAMAFARQNYQILGWMWCPIAFYALAEGDAVIASFAWFAAGIFGVTPVFLGSIVVFLISLEQGSFLPILTLIPAFILVAIRFIYLLQFCDILNSIMNFAKLIGVTGKNICYKRNMQLFNAHNCYYISIYLFSIFLLSFMIGCKVLYPITGVLMYFVNRVFLRVADDQSLYLLVSSLFVFVAIQGDPHVITAVAVLVAVNPAGFFISIQNVRKNCVSPIHIFCPYDHSVLLSRISSLFRNIPSGSKIYSAFNNPDGQYSKIFDGYRVIYELPLYVASINNLHMFPDWYAVGDTNYDGAPIIWGRSLDEVRDICRRWNASYVMIYQSSNTEIDERWYSYFDKIAEFDWAEHLYLLNGFALWPDELPCPKWFILKFRG